MDYTIEKLRKKIKSKDGQRLVQRAKKQYEENYEGVPLRSLTYSKFRLICSTGDRTAYEEEYCALRIRWTLLNVLALDDDGYIEPLEDLLSAICDEFSWTLPAHSVTDREKGIFDYTFIDISAAETAAYLSETVATFGDKLSLDIRARIEYSLQTKIADVFESRTFRWETRTGSNWAAVCAGCIGITYLYAFPERFPAMENRILSALTYYTDGFPEDGACEEGVSYCIYGLGFLCAFLDIYAQKYGKMPAYFGRARKRIVATLEYYMNGILDGRYLPFGDVSGEPVTDFPMQELIFKKVFPKEFLLADYDYCGKSVLETRAFAGMRLVDSIGRYEDGERRGRGGAIAKYYKSRQIFLFQNGRYAFAVKGGNNAEMHNHNDLGAFCLSVKGKRIVADLGSGLYSYAYFDDAVRYNDEIFVCSSQAHSVPVIGGEYQKFGGQYTADTVKAGDNGVAFDISKAYGLKEGSLRVEYECEESALSVRYVFRSDKKTDIVFRFVSDFKPCYRDGKLFIEGTEVLYDRKCKTAFGEREYQTKEGVTKTANLLDFSVKEREEIALEFRFKAEE